MDIAKYGQQKLSQYFERIYPSAEVRANKRTLRIASDIYSPVPDIMVGPFAIETLRYEHEFDKLARRASRFLNLCIAFHNANARVHGLGGRSSVHLFTGSDSINRNARCSIAIEIESGKNSRKHLLGSAFNAIALGRIAILVGETENVVEMFVRALKYFNYLENAGKPSTKFGNALILSKTQFREILDQL